MGTKHILVGYMMKFFVTDTLLLVTRHMTCVFNFSPHIHKNGTCNSSCSNSQTVLAKWWEMREHKWHSLYTTWRRKWVVWVQGTPVLVFFYENFQLKMSWNAMWKCGHTVLLEQHVTGTFFFQNVYTKLVTMLWAKKGN
jgi:hypothetical protein